MAVTCNQLKVVWHIHKQTRTRWTSLTLLESRMHSKLLFDQGWENLSSDTVHDLFLECIWGSHTIHQHYKSIEAFSLHLPSSNDTSQLVIFNLPRIWLSQLVMTVFKFMKVLCVKGMCNISINNWSSSWTPHIDKVAGSYCKSNNHLHIRWRKLYIMINSNCRCLCTLRMGIECRLHFPNAYPVSTVQCRKCSWSDVCSAQELTPATHNKLILNCQKFIQVSVTSKTVNSLVVAVN